MMRFNESLFKAPKQDDQLSHHPPAPLPRRRKAPAAQPRSMNISPHTVLTIYPDQTAGGQKLIQLPPESIERMAQEELEAYRRKAAFIEQWLKLPKREYEPYT